MSVWNLRAKIGIKEVEGGQLKACCQGNTPLVINSILRSVPTLSILHIATISLCVYGMVISVKEAR